MHRRRTPWLPASAPSLPVQVCAAYNFAWGDSPLGSSCLPNKTAWGLWHDGVFSRSSSACCAHHAHRAHVALRTTLFVVNVASSSPGDSSRATPSFYSPPKHVPTPHLTPSPPGSAAQSSLDTGAPSRAPCGSVGSCSWHCWPIPVRLALRVTVVIGGGEKRRRARVLQRRQRQLGPRLECGWAAFRPQPVAAQP